MSQGECVFHLRNTAYLLDVVPSNPLPYPISPPPIPHYDILSTKDLVAKQLPKGRGISQRYPPSVPPMLLVWHFIYILCLALYTDSSAWFHLSSFYTTLNFMVTICTASSLIWRLFLRVNKNQIVTENWVRLGKKVTMTRRPKLQHGTCMHMLQCNCDCERSSPLILCVCTCRLSLLLITLRKRWLPAASDSPIHLTLPSSTRSKKPFGKYISIVPLPWAEESLGTRLYVYYHLSLSPFLLSRLHSPHLIPPVGLFSSSAILALILQNFPPHISLLQPWRWQTRLTGATSSADPVTPACATLPTAVSWTVWSSVSATRGSCVITRESKRCYLADINTSNP